MKDNETAYRTRVEIKNINSFRFIEKAVEFEILRQIDVYEDGGSIYQETRLYDSAKNKTFSMRGKEEAKDYRYFQDPDLLPVKIEESWIESIKESLPELPRQKALRFQADLGLPEYDALVLTQDKKMADYFEAVVAKCKAPKTASNWIMGELLKNLNEARLEFEQNTISADHLAELVSAIEDQTISGKMGKNVFAEMWKTQKSPKSIIAEQGMSQITDPAAVEKVVMDVINANPGQVEQYRSGKNKLFGFFVGQVMKVSKGQANPDMVNDVLKRILDGQ
jgi:aspartyl-tRNA(Asn)/glutamyl-tRNA(Gln) amidotransferase subunit B